MPEKIVSMELEYVDTDHLVVSDWRVRRRRVVKVYVCRSDQNVPSIPASRKEFLTPSSRIRCVKERERRENHHRVRFYVHSKMIKSIILYIKFILSPLSFPSKFSIMKQINVTLLLPSFSSLLPLHEKRKQKMFLKEIFL